MIFGIEHRTQPISKLQVKNAFERVKQNKGAGGIDGVVIKDVEQHIRKYLYPLWNRMSSGSYFPKAVRQVLIPKEKGKFRALGIPTVVDRVAQQVIATELESIVDKQFSPNSYGYRPNKSAREAIEQCQKNCMKSSWVIDLDIKGFFDNIDHELLLKTVMYHTKAKHIIMYVKRWLNAPIQEVDGTIRNPNGKGTPQGGVISPVLANIFLDIVFDKWMAKHHPGVNFERYADDIVIHCHNIKESIRLLSKVRERFESCKLELNQSKSKIVYCRRNQKRQPPFQVQYQKFDFLGFTFKPRVMKQKGKIRLGFTPAISSKNVSRIGKELFKLNVHRFVHVPLPQLAKFLNHKIRGWINYYGRFRFTALKQVFRLLHNRLVQWLRNKYRKLRSEYRSVSYKRLKEIAIQFPNMFEHWKYPNLRP